MWRMLASPLNKVKAVGCFLNSPCSLFTNFLGLSLHKCCCTARTEDGGGIEDGWGQGGALHLISCLKHSFKCTLVNGNCLEGSCYYQIASKWHPDGGNAQLIYTLDMESTVGSPCFKSNISLHQWDRWVKLLWYKLFHLIPPLTHDSQSAPYSWIDFTHLLHLQMFYLALSSLINVCLGGESALKLRKGGVLYKLFLNFFQNFFLPISISFSVDQKTTALYFTQ